MAKRRATSGKKGLQVPESSGTAAIAQAARAGIEKKCGRQPFSGADPEVEAVGLPLPSFSLKYLLQSTVFPLCRIYQIVGQEGSAKSALLFEIFRWHLQYGGFSLLAENENKYSAELCRAVLRNRKEWLDNLTIVQTLSLEEWQDVFTATIDAVRKVQDKQGCRQPVCLAVDSLLGTAPQEELDQLRKGGHAIRGHALGAYLISRYMRTVPERINGYPITVVGTNHYKPSRDARGLPTANVPGGYSVKFMETTEILMSRVGTRGDLETATHGGLRVEMLARKNGAGPSRKRIVADFLWWFEPDEDGDGVIQHAYWDWHAATTDLLLSFENRPGFKRKFKDVRDLLGLGAVRSRRRAWATELDIPKDDPQPYSVIGLELAKRPEIERQLYPLFGITERKAYRPGEDYRQICAEQLEAAREKAREIVRQKLLDDAAHLPGAELYEESGDE